MIIRKPSVNTSYAAEVLRMGDMSTCYKQSIALGSISIPRGPSMLIREFVADMDGSLQFSSWVGNGEKIPVIEHRWPVYAVSFERKTVSKVPLQVMDCQPRVFFFKRAGLAERTMCGLS